MPPRPVLRPFLFGPDKSWSWPILWMAGISFLSHQSSVVVSEPISHAAAAAGIPTDKVFHFGWAAVLGLLVAKMRRRRGEPLVNPWVAMCIVAVFGAVDELHQAFVPGRSPEFMDFIADITGGAVGIWLARNFLRRSRAISCDHGTLSSPVSSSCRPPENDDTASRPLLSSLR